MNAFGTPIVYLFNPANGDIAAVTHPESMVAHYGAWKRIAADEYYRLRQAIQFAIVHEHAKWESRG